MSSEIAPRGVTEARSWLGSLNFSFISQTFGVVVIMFGVFLTTVGTTADHFVGTADHSELGLHAGIGSWEFGMEFG